MPYDFRRPIQLSREHSRILQLGFDGFARQATTVFTSSLRTVCGVSLATIEQRSYAEYVDSLDASTYLTLFAADPEPGTYDAMVAEWFRRQIAEGNSVDAEVSAAKLSRLAGGIADPLTGRYFTAYDDLDAIAAGAASAARRAHQHHHGAGSDAAMSRSLCFMTLPVALRGSSSTNQRCRGRL